MINLSGYDLILGTLFLLQHHVTFEIDPAKVVIGLSQAVQMKGSGVTQLASQSMELYEENLEIVHKELCQYGEPICKLASDTPLLPMQAINHEINLIDPDRIYSWQPSQCPEAM